jgi:hypothetical protein
VNQYVSPSFEISSIQLKGPDYPGVFITWAFIGLT